MIVERARERRKGLAKERAKGQAVIQYFTKLQRDERGRSNMLRAKGRMLAVSACLAVPLLSVLYSVLYIACLSAVHNIAQAATL